MDIGDHIKAIQEHGLGLVHAAERAGLDAPVPTCPDWLVRDLVAHQGQVHRWAATYLTTGRTDAGVPLEDAPDDGELLGWFREGHARLVDGLTNASPDLECWSFLPAPSPLAFWARRQAHETTIHRADAEAAARSTLDVEPALAVDGIDELLLRFHARSRGRLVSDPPVTLGIRVTDGRPDDAWSITVRADGRETTRGEAIGDCVVEGSAGDVYQFLWNRLDRSAVRIDGDVAVLDLWQDKGRITWS